MDEEKKTITTTKLTEFLGIKYTRLHVWMEENILILDNPLPGAGHTGRFGFDDVVVAKVVTDLMRMTGNFKIAKEATMVSGIYMKTNHLYGRTFCRPKREKLNGTMNSIASILIIDTLSMS